MEFVRHRVFSFAQESTRYCNYSSNRFGNELTFIIPSWIDKTDLDLRNRMCEDDWGKLFAEYYYDLTDKGKEEFLLSEYPRDVQNFLWGLFVSEQLYLTLLKQEWKPQQARAILPNSLKTELVMTAFISDWKHFFDLRYFGKTGKPHPDAKKLAEELYYKFLNLNLL
jgi:thymidylate synthase (FAD)